MAWETDITIMVRYLINDVDSGNYTYSDDRLHQTIAVAAYFLTNDTDLGNSYTIDLSAPSISPDPTESATKDDDFITLSALKTACIILGSEVKAEAGNAISIKDGPSAIDLRGVAGTLSSLYQDLCKKYDQALLDYRAGTSLAGQAILGPYSPGSDFVSRTHSDYDHRGNYFRY